MTVLLQFSLFVLYFIAILFPSSVVFAKSIVVWVDGTGNHLDDANNHGHDCDTTNVFRLSELSYRTTSKS